MLTLPTAMRAAQDEGKALPTVYAALAAEGAHPRRGQITMIVSIPGGGKSLLTLDWIINLGDHGLKGMYFSNDTDRMTLGKRACADLLEITIDEAEKLLASKDETAWAILDDAMAHVWFSFDADTGLEDIENELNCYALVNGCWPDFVVIDVLMNVHGDVNDSGDHTQFGEAMQWFHGTARNTQAAFFVLHHTTGEAERTPSQPVAMGGVLGKVSKLARLILTLYRPTEEILGVSVVKNTSGKADASGWNIVARIPFDPARSWFMKEAQRFEPIKAQASLGEPREWSPSDALDDVQNDINGDDW